MSRIRKLPKDYNEYSLEDLKKLINQPSETQKKRIRKKLR
jgi:hypothetical protein